MIQFNFKKKNYIFLSVTMLCLSIYIVFFPLFARIMYRISPILTTCVYQNVTGRPCPLCGGTRFISGIKDNLFNLSYYNCPFGYMIMFVIFEIIFRNFLFIYLRTSNKIKGIVIFDVVIHSLCFLLFIAYEIIYILSN